MASGGYKNPEPFEPGFFGWPLPSPFSPLSVGRCFDWSMAVDSLTVFGLFAVTAMLVFYALEDRSHWFVLAFAVACAVGSVYGFFQGAWPFGVVEAIRALVAVRRWWMRMMFV